MQKSANGNEHVRRRYFAAYSTPSSTPLFRRMADPKLADAIPPRAASSLADVSPPRARPRACPCAACRWRLPSLGKDGTICTRSCHIRCTNGRSASAIRTRADRHRSFRLSPRKGPSTQAFRRPSLALSPPGILLPSRNKIPQKRKRRSLSACETPNKLRKCGHMSGGAGTGDGFGEAQVSGADTDMCQGGAGVRGGCGHAPGGRRCQGRVRTCARGRRRGTARGREPVEGESHSGQLGQKRNTARQPPKQKLSYE